MNRIKICLSTGKAVLIPHPASFLMELNGITDEEELCELQANEFYIYHQKKNNRVTGERPFKRIVFENMLDFAFKIDFLWEFVLEGTRNFEDYHDSFVRKVNSLDDNKFNSYYRQLERNNFRSCPSGVAFFCPEAVQHCFNNYEADPLHAFFGLVFNLFFYQYLGQLFQQSPPIIPARSLNRHEVFELNQELVKLACPLVQQSFAIFERNL